MDHEMIVSRMVDYFASGSKGKEQMRYGLEAEHFIVDRKTKKSVPYDGAGGIQSLLREISPHFSREVSENGNVLGLINDDAALSLEPGSQLEISVKQNLHIADTIKIYNNIFQMVQALLEKRGQALMTQGYLPASSVKELSLLPKPRYFFMDQYFTKTGTMGINMMRGTASCQISIDYTDEGDFIDKYRCACILSPIFALISGNTPVFERKPNGNPLIRTKIWRNVDAERTGILRDTFSPDFSFRKYAEYVLGQNAIFEGSNGAEQASRRRVIDVLSDPGTEPDAFMLYLSLVFPDVRLRQYIEIRVADSMPVEKTAAYMALLKGLFCDVSGLKSLLNRFFWSREGIVDAQNAIMEKGRHAMAYGEPVLSVINEIMAFALSRLENGEQELLRKGFAPYEL
jgi:glutamate--cysteine ligase